MVSQTISISMLQRLSSQWEIDHTQVRIQLYVFSSVQWGYMHKVRRQSVA